MGKKKDAAALFEVITRNKERRTSTGLGVPGWMGKTDRDKQQQQQSPPVGEDEAPPSVPTRTQMPAASRLSAPAVSTEGGRLRLSLDYISCTAIAVGFIVLLVVAFWIGRTTAPEGPAEQAGMKAPYNPGVAVSGKEKKTTKTPPGAERIKGKYYLVIQGMMGDNDELEKEAHKIVKYCRRNGEPASVVRYTDPRTGKKQLLVWSKTPFDSPNSTTAQQHAKTIEEMGKRYDGDYDFRQRRNGEFDPWFIKYRD